MTGERSQGTHKQLGCNVQISVLFSHTVTLHSLVYAESSTTCVGHRLPSSCTSLYCSKLVHCIVPLLSGALINMKIIIKDYKLKFIVKIHVLITLRLVKLVHLFILRSEVRL
jgi:hypothetical protein